MEAGGRGRIFPRNCWHVRDSSSGFPESPSQLSAACHFVGLMCGAALRLAVYLRGKNAKKYRHNVEYGSARWGTAADIAPFIAPKFEDNIILTKTERLMMSNRPKNPANARNKNVLIVGGSGSGQNKVLAEAEPAPVPFFVCGYRSERKHRLRVWKRAIEAWVSD